MPSERAPPAPALWCALRDRGSPPTAPPAPSRPVPTHGAPTHPLLSSPGTPMSDRVPGPRRLALWKPSGVKLQLLGQLCHWNLRLGTPMGSSSRAWPAQGPGRSPSPPWPVYLSADRGQAGASLNGSGKEDCQGHSRELRALCWAAGAPGPQCGAGGGKAEGGASGFQEGSRVPGWR